jgi:hypothetical protein
MSLDFRWPAIRQHSSSQWLSMFHCGHCLQVTLICRLAEFRSAMQIGDSFAAATPRFRAIVLPLLFTTQFHIARIADRGFDTGHRLLIILHLN